MVQNNQNRNTGANSTGNRSNLNKPNYNKIYPRDNRSVVKDGNKQDKPAKRSRQSS